MTEDKKSGTESLADSGNWDRFWSDSKGTEDVSWSKKRIINILKKYVAPNMWTLDAGSGSGFFSDWFVHQGCFNVSLDYSPAALEKTREITEGKCVAYISEDLTDPELASRSPARFDIIFSDGLFEHFGEDTQKKIMKNLKGLLKEEGLIISFVPNLFTPWTVIRPFFMPGIKEKPFTAAALERLYEENGGLIEESGGINIIPAQVSPEGPLGRYFGMLVYAVGRFPVDGDA